MKIPSYEFCLVSPPLIGLVKAKSCAKNYHPVHGIKAKPRHVSILGHLLPHAWSAYKLMKLGKKLLNITQNSANFGKAFGKSCLQTTMKRTQHFLILFVKGMSMGIAELIPSVSSATIALITGIYGELLSAIQSLNITALQLLAQGKGKAFWQYIHGNFLLVLCLGMITSLLTTINLLGYLLAEQGIQTWSFFFGLMLISCITIYQQIKKFTYTTLPISFLGALMAYGIGQATPLQGPESLWFILLAGAIAVCAMILPGISGSFMLLLLGKYTVMLDALQHLHWQRLLVFMVGGIIGLLGFSRVLNWLLHKHYDRTMSLLAGFMAGSLPKVWPWKQVVKTLDTIHLSENILVNNVSPVQFQVVYCQDPLIFQALLWMSLGCLLVISLEKLSAKGRRNKQFL